MHDGAHACPHTHTSTACTQGMCACKHGTPKHVCMYPLTHGSPKHVCMNACSTKGHVHVCYGSEAIVRLSSYVAPATMKPVCVYVCLLSQAERSDACSCLGGFSAVIVHVFTFFFPNTFSGKSIHEKCENVKKWIAHVFTFSHNMDT